MLSFLFRTMNTSASRRVKSQDARTFLCRLLACITLFGLAQADDISAQTLAEKEKTLAANHRAKISANPIRKAATSKTNSATGDTSSQTFSGFAAEDDETFSVGPNGATVTLTWEMYMIPDRLELVLPSSNALPGVPLPSFDYFATGSVQGEGSFSSRRGILRSKSS